jgi:hypothetical protein
MGQHSLSVRDAAAMARCGRHCAIEAGVIGRLAYHECSHGPLAFEPAPACGLLVG